ncbi:MAG: N-acyl homoserine lactonase family protein [Chloroflexota bacterium]|nr:N-acyl homoserine lactonase family protein [Chloroflexota bacterium]
MRLYLLRLGRSADGIPVPGYLIRAPERPTAPEGSDGTAVLVDAGFPEHVYRAADPAHWARPTPADWVVNRLAELGLTPGDIGYIIVTHLDPDHAGGLAAFPGAERVVQRAHLAAARSGRFARFNQTRALWDDPAARWHEVDGDAELLPGIELIASPGHVPGHQSLLVRLPETGPVLLAADAVPRRFDPRRPETRPANPFDLDPAAALDSALRLYARAEREGARLIAGHDPDQWRDLKTSPDFYA